LSGFGRTVQHQQGTTGIMDLPSQGETPPSGDKARPRTSEPFERNTGAHDGRIPSSDPSLDLELFHYNPLETIIVDRQGRVMDFNLAKKSSEGRLPNRGDLMYVDYAAHHETDMRAELMACMARNASRTFPALKYKSKYIRVTISPFPKGAIIVSQNVTDQTVAEEALRKSERALRESEREKNLILNSVLESVTYQSLDRRIIWANPLTEQTFHAGPGELTGRRCHALWNASDSPCPDCPVPDILETGFPRRTEQTTPDGRIWAGRSYPVRGDEADIIGIVEVRLDVTEQKRAEAEKAKIQTQLFQSQKMEAIGTLAGGVAHDFNNLLTAIQGCMDLALMKIPDDHDAIHDLQEVQTASQRAAELTRQLLLFSRRHLTHLEPLQLNRTVEDLLKMLHRLIGEDIEIVTHPNPDLWNVLADRGTLEQVIVNLSVNARDAMPKGGKLTIRTENVELDDFYCRMVPDARPGRFVRLSISDTGAGMSREVRERIFEPFFSTKGPGKGTGLGLSVVYGIVKMHNGWINVYTETGQGSEFKIYLPAASAAVAEQAQPVVAAGDYRGRGERILVVEDERMVREFSLRALEKYGYRVHAVSTLEEALAAFRDENASLDMVFTDVVLPDGNGITMVETVLEKKPGMKIVLTSGYTDTKSQWKVIKRRGFRFLQKPFTLVDLLQTVRTEMDKA
jgi:two-component system cell cycle sensor histidine kinase/response regulator CckA